MAELRRVDPGGADGVWAGEAGFLAPGPGEPRGGIFVDEVYEVRETGRRLYVINVHMDGLKPVSRAKRAMSRLFALMNAGDTMSVATWPAPGHVRNAAMHRKGIEEALKKLRVPFDEDDRSTPMIEFHSGPAQAAGDPQPPTEEETLRIVRPFRTEAFELRNLDGPGDGSFLSSEGSLFKGGVFLEKSVEFEGGARLLTMMVDMRPDRQPTARYKRALWRTGQLMSSKDVLLITPSPPKGMRADHQRVRQAMRWVIEEKLGEPLGPGEQHPRIVLAYWDERIR